jgi:Phosphorylated CTD interacting factor 1 WW domain
MLSFISITWKQLKIEFRIRIEHLTDKFLDKSVMSKFRGDDDLFAIMAEMSSEQGYETKVDVNEGRDQEARLQATKRIKLCHDVQENEVSLGIESIWNPFVAINDYSIGKTKIMAPTNPHVEVFRRRAYERFKVSVNDLFERINGNSTKTGMLNLWRDLNIVSLLEKFQFSVKMMEAEILKETQSLQKLNAELWTTTQVHSFIQIASNNKMWMDPILISRSLEFRKNSEDGIISRAMINELEFEWTRAWRKKVESKTRDSELSCVFTSKKFKRMVDTLLRGINSISLEAMDSFQNSLAKRAREESLRSRPNRQLLPKLTTSDECSNVSFSGLNFSINHEHLEKLKVLFDRQNQISQTHDEHRAKFVSCLFSLLARYDMIQGAGLQAAMRGAIFDVLKNQFDCILECFASPLNCRYEHFLSAFPDTDSPFGSLGSFFDFDFMQGGSYQANPPFIDNFIFAMQKRMERYLSDCEKPLMFIVFVPAWTNTLGWKALRGSIHLKQHILIDQASHYYTEGTQYRRKETMRVASFDTSIFFLQNDAGSNKWKIKDSDIEELKSSFSL